MPGIVTTLLHGPRLEELRHWGRLDSLLWSLDSEVWAQADIFGLRAAVTLPLRTKGRAKMIYGGARCHAAARTRTRGVATVDNIRCRTVLHVNTAGCDAPVLRIAVCRSGLRLIPACRGEKRGHNWVIVPVTGGIWTEREL